MSSSSAPRFFGALVVAALLVAVVWFALRSENAHSDEHVAASDPQSAAIDSALIDPATAQPAAARVASTSPGESAPVTAVGGRLRGTVRLREGELPLANVRVDIRLAQGSARVTNTLTNSDGEYVFEWDSPATVRSISVAASAETTAVFQWGDWRVSAGQTQHVDLWVTRGGTLSGRVVDASGAALPGASVLAWSGSSFDPTRPPDREVACARDGSFRVEHLGEFVLVARLEGWTCSRGLRGRLDAVADARDLVVQLVPAFTLRGRVVDAGHAGISGAAITIEAHGASSSTDATSVPGVSRFRPVNLAAASGADGTFELGPVPEQDWNVRVRHDEYIEQFAELDPRGDNEIVLDGGITLRGIVRGAERLPVAGAHVRASGRVGNERTLVTNSEGRFDARGFAVGEHSFVGVRADGYALFCLQPLDAERVAQAELELQLEPAAPLAGRVVDERGVPIVDALVAIEGDRVLEYDARFDHKPTLEYFLDENELRTDASGRFSFAHAYAGEYELRISPAETPELVHVETARAGGGELTIVVDRSKLEHVVFAGRVLDGITRKPLREYTLTIMVENDDGEMWGKNREIRDAAGAFRVPGFLPGQFELRVRAPGYAGYASARVALADGTSEHEIKLFPSRSLQLAMRWKGPRPHNQTVTASFEDAQGKALLVGTGGSTSAVHVGTAASNVAGLPAALVRVTVRAAARGIPVVEREIDLRVPSVEPLVFELDGSLADEPMEARLMFGSVADAALLDASRAALNAAYDARKVGVPEQVEFEMFAADGSLLVSGTSEVKFGKPGEKVIVVTTLHYPGSSEPVMISGEDPYVVAKLPRRLAKVRVSGPGLVERTWTPPPEGAEFDGTILILRAK